MEVEILLKEVGSYQQDSEPFISPLPSCLCFLSSTREAFLSFYHDALLHHDPEARKPANAGCKPLKPWAKKKNPIFPPALLLVFVPVSEWHRRWWSIPKLSQLWEGGTLWVRGLADDLCGTWLWSSTCSAPRQSLTADISCLPTKGELISCGYKASVCHLGWDCQLSGPGAVLCWLLLWFSVKWGKQTRLILCTVILI